MFRLGHYIDAIIRMKILKTLILFFSLAFTALLLIYLLVMRFVPAFGGDLTAEQKQQFKQQENFQNGKFVNRRAVPEPLNLAKFLELGYAFFTTKVVNGKPATAPEVITIDKNEMEQYTGTRLFWFGHSTFLVQHQGKNILIDPMFGQVPAPMDFLGDKRFNDSLPLPPHDLPKIDYVVFSHDHYDHLDYQSVLQIKDKVGQFLCPLGLGNHLRLWGVEEDKIIELNWWEEKKSEAFSFACTPAQHFSGRKFSNGQETLWASWVIQAEGLSLYFSGDSGYDTHFKSIGEKYGPFDLALVECGQYNKLWPDVHMFPQETVQAGIDLKAKKIIPIHWGAFKLAMHPWNEPPLVAVKEAKEKGIPIEIPKIGQAIQLDSLATTQSDWYK